jgi:Lar family restriction alleviation protein
MDEATEDLKPCPFCGSAMVGVVCVIDDDADADFSVRCDGCLSGTATISCGDDATSRRLAIAAWNRRA